MISLEPPQFRSPLLDALPPVPPGRSGRPLRRRWLAVILVVSAVVLPAAAVGRRWLSPEGPGRLLYWLHDGLYLPLKGYLFTWLFPVSWIYLFSGLTLLLFSLAAVLWKRPLTSAWQTVVGRRALSWPWMRPVLRIWARTFREARRRSRAAAVTAERWPATGKWLARWAGALEGPTLLEELIEHEREAGLERLDGLDPVDPESVRALAPAVDATLLSTEAAFSFPRFDLPVVEAVARLDDALLRLDLVRLARADPEPAITELRVRLETEISTLLRPLLPVRPPRPDFSLPSLAMELALVLGLEAPRSWPSEFLENRPDRVLEGVQARRRGLDGNRRRLERSTAFELRRGRRIAGRRIAGRRIAGRRIAVELPGPAGRSEARIAMDVALFAALRHGAFRAALGFLESLEGLRFAVLAAGGAGEPSGDGDEEAETEADALLSAFAGLPRPLDYRACAVLLGREMAGAGDLAAAIARRSEVVSEADLRLIAARRTELSSAAAEPPSSRTGG